MSAAIRLKADLHTHTAGDLHDPIPYSAEMLIDAAAKLNYDVLAITCHEVVRYSKRLEEYAKRRGILLIPGIEQLVDGKHVVILNPDDRLAEARTFRELRSLGHRDAALIAAHPFYPIPSSLGALLVRHIDLFDAVEYASLFCRGINLNRRAAKTARRYGLSMVATSDVHTFPYVANAWTWIKAEPTIRGVIEAIRSGRVQIVARPRSVVNTATAMACAARGMFS